MKTAEDPMPPETIYVASHTVACDGGSQVVGHPRVYIPLDNKTHSGECGYCDRRFVYDPAKAGQTIAKAHG